MYWLTVVGVFRSSGDGYKGEPGEKWFFVAEEKDVIYVFLAWIHR